MNPTEAKITAPAGGPPMFVEEAGLDSAAGEGTSTLGAMFLGFCISPSLPSCSSQQPLNHSGLQNEILCVPGILSICGNFAVIFRGELCGQKCCFIVLFSPLGSQNKFSGRKKNA